MDPRNFDYAPICMGKESGPAAFKSGENVSYAVIGYPQRGPSRRDGSPTITVSYSPSKVRGDDLKSSRAVSVEAAKAALRTMEAMLQPKILPKSRIRCQIYNIQDGANEIEATVNAISLALLQSTYDLRDVITAVSFTRNHVGEPVFFPSETIQSLSTKERRPLFQFHFNKDFQVIWMESRGTIDADSLFEAEQLCREAAKSIVERMRQAVLECSR